MLKVYEQIPAGLLELAAERLHEILPGPTLIHLPGRRPAPLFASVLLHGNEETGWLAAREVLRKYARSDLPRALSLFIGNIAAARHGLRVLDGQPDYNRIWPGAAASDRPEFAMARQVVEAMRARGVFASIDIHNNTGLNPHYGCVNRLEPAWLHLATLFSRTVVYFTYPRGVQSAAFAELCPAVTLECGKPGTPQGVEHAASYMDACLRLSEFPAHPVQPRDIDLFHTIATVKVPEEARFAFSDMDCDIEFAPDLDHLNFRELQPGTHLGRIHGRRGFCLQALDDEGKEMGDQVFDCSDGEIRLRRPLMPAMLTRDARVIRQDCLCYLMERLPLPA
ncbi:MAG: M14 family metallopeptidase [Gallionellaceae bacterium]|nr:M14 family metallopeptidase [Gallionellaceae bacterium]